MSPIATLIVASDEPIDLKWVRPVDSSRLYLYDVDGNALRFKYVAEAAPGTWTRYYGPNWERGSAGFVVAVAYCLEAACPHGRIFYGHDEGSPFVEFTRERRNALCWLSRLQGDEGENVRAALERSCGLYGVYSDEPMQDLVDLYRERTAATTHPDPPSEQPHEDLE